MYLPMPGHLSIMTGIINVRKTEHMKNKHKTNDQLIRAFLKDLTPFEIALLRERLIKISEITRAAIKTDRKSFNNFLLTATDWEIFLDKIDKHLHFDEPVKL
jgi:hypothetical protein